MINIGVVSDSHLLCPAALDDAACLLRREGIDRLIHLGDGYLDGLMLGELLDVPVTSVAGNCDERPDVAHEVTMGLEDVRLLMRHGHLLRVKSSLLRLKLHAQERGCQVALFGHTHMQMAEWQDGVLFLNPGALRDGCFALLRLNGGHIQWRLHGPRAAW